MSHHEGVSCDSCLKANFRGKRHKCLVCFDYDLCSTCHENGATSTRHNADHPMQCILTRSDVELFYGGESVVEIMPQALTCPFCGRMGLTETNLLEHVNAEHMDATQEVVCPICAYIPSGEPNNVTDDFATHLQVEHRNSRELEPQTAIRGRRAPHPTRSMNATRTRRTQMTYASNGGLTSGLSASLSPGNRDSMDPIAELLSQLSGVRRAAGSLGQAHPHSQLQQLQMQLQLERHAGAPQLSSRQTFASDRAPIERVIRRHQTAAGHGASAGLSGGVPVSQSNAINASAAHQQSPYVVLMEPSPSPATLAHAASAAQNAAHLVGVLSSQSAQTLNSVSSRFLLSRCNESNSSESEQQLLEVAKADKSLFVQELLLTTMTEAMAIGPRDRQQPMSSSTTPAPPPLAISASSVDRGQRSSHDVIRSPSSNPANSVPDSEFDLNQLDAASALAEKVIDEEQTDIDDGVRESLGAEGPLVCPPPPLQYSNAVVNGASSLSSNLNETSSPAARSMSQGSDVVMAGERKRRSASSNSSQSQASSRYNSNLVGNNSNKPGLRVTTTTSAVTAVVNENS